MMIILFFLFGLILFFYNFFYKYFLSNFFFFIVFFLLLNCGNSLSNWYFIGYNLGLNLYSYYLVMLVFFMMGVILKVIDGDNYLCINLNLFLTLVLFLTFCSLSFLMFYFFFEVSLIIVYIIIIKWGMGIMRMISGFYFMFYTLFFSLPLLIFILYLTYMFNSSIMLILELMNVYVNYYLYMYMCMGFLLKVPMYMFHGWLLKAHVEAPVFGSMVLASILLKLGTYGLLRFLMIFYLNTVNISKYILIFSIIGGIYISCVCLRQVDMKVLVAYSSVVHMSLLLSSMFTLMKVGFLGSYILMISHGLCSSALFYLVNIFYSETGSRLMLINKGLLICMPSMSMLWFFMCSSNMASPVSLNLVGEILLMMSLIFWMKFIFLFLVFYAFFSFIYSLYMYSYVCHGKSNFFLKMNSGIMMNYFILLIHWIPLNFLFLNLVMFYYLNSLN
uniref:NADH-ubiquinone oxidoreductase chain 4 n=1 Tax=Andrena labiata TaxID=1431441 RepID=A0A0S2LSR9_9HYME|nr:NADH dehydrogenase subunit 4 [Andrena labiata]